MNGAEQQSLPGMDLERATVLSPSALERYRLCPLLYRFLYVDGLWRMSRSSSSQAFGNSVHAALREFYRLPVGRRSLRMLLELFRRLWVRDGYQGGEQQRRERERGAEALRAWYGRTDTTVVPHATELGLQAAWGDVVLKGRLDRLDPDPGSDRGLVVIDYKTGRRPVSQEAADADEALTIYAALVERRLGRPVTRMVLDYVVAGTQVVTGRPPEVLRSRLDEVLATAGRLRADTEFRPNPGPWCTGCDLLSRCPAGQQEVAGETARLD
jgi:putative RecB family exonuclease